MCLCVGVGVGGRGLYSNQHLLGAADGLTCPLSQLVPPTNPRAYGTELTKYCHAQVANLVELSENDELSLAEASRICNRKIISHVQQVICFAFHDSRLLLETCHEAKDSKKIVTLFYLD